MATILVAGVLGTDLSIVNAARASLAKESLSLTPQDRDLIRYLAGHRKNSPRTSPHDSPFRHGVLRYDLTTTLRQRLQWEGQQNRMGMVFIPSLDDLANTRNLDSVIRWRWTVSLSAVVRFSQQVAQHPYLTQFGHIALLEAADYFPACVEALTGLHTESSLSPTSPPQVLPASVPVLDHGYVRLAGTLLGPSPQETVLTLEVKAPLMVRAQWFKYHVDSEHTPLGFFPSSYDAEVLGNGSDGSDDSLYARNEASRRYVTMEPDFYLPMTWRTAPEQKKQGSGGPVPKDGSAVLTAQLQEDQVLALQHYHQALRDGVAPEQARLFLPSYALYTAWRWTASLPAVQHFLQQRSTGDAQEEIREYAEAVRRTLASGIPNYGTAPEP